LKYSTCSHFQFFLLNSFISYLLLASYC
jgi:hypothetical protein